MSAFFVWAALAASAVFWALRLGAGSPTAPAHTVPVSEVVVQRADLTRIFGAEPVAAPTEAPAPEVSSRFHLLGVVAPRVAGAPGVALIAVDGKPPRAYRLGAAVDGEMVLQDVQARGVALGPQGGAATVRLELPPLPAAATGALPPPSFGAAPAPAAPLPPPVAAVQGQQPPRGNMVPPTAVRLPAPTGQPPQAPPQQVPEQVQQQQQQQQPVQEQQPPAPMMQEGVTR
ncbi:type II secretion system protein N [Ideonella sp. BN130291]|uniref:type II secretion system protein N n=1 Tax=Ideonella sp. BN130291 TaxID=3112940 RepID=UPI002E25415C